MRKLALILFLAITLASVPALAGKMPEFDAVGNDSNNYFVFKQCSPYTSVKQLVVDENLFGPYLLNGELSDWYMPQNGPLDPWYPPSFPTYPDGLYLGEGFAPFEIFYTGSGLVVPDLVCFPGYFAALTPKGNSGRYQWVIVLQSKPQSDLNINIRDCVLSDSQKDIWTAAEQTGRFTYPFGANEFWKYSNPSITVVAIPGQFASDPAFYEPFVMTARKMPGLWKTYLYEALYTSKALWDEGIIVRMPQTGYRNDRGKYQYTLHQGDMIFVEILVPQYSTADIWYGKDNVIVKYVGLDTQLYVNVDNLP